MIPKQDSTEATTDENRLQGRVQAFHALGRDQGQDRITEFHKGTALRHYDERHTPLSAAEESGLINSKVPRACPHCGSPDFRKEGFSANGIQMYRCCACGRKFTVITGTVCRVANYPSKK